MLRLGDSGESKKVELDSRLDVIRKWGQFYDCLCLSVGQTDQCRYKAVLGKADTVTSFSEKGGLRSYEFHNDFFFPGFIIVLDRHGLMFREIVTPNREPVATISL